MDIKLRKVFSGLEEIFHDGGPPLDEPHCKGFVAAVIENPFAGRFEPDLMAAMEALKPLGLELAGRLIDIVADGEPALVQAYGKGAIVGEAGELEHGALWHAPGGYAMRELLGEALAIVPSSKKVAGIGAKLDVPLHHINAAYVRSHFDAIEVGIADAPKANEILLVLAMTTGPRPHARVGGLSADEIKKKDGLR